MHIEGEYTADIKVSEKACTPNKSKPYERMRGDFTAVQHMEIKNRKKK